MQEPERTAPYRKDPNNEAILKGLNDDLRPLEEELERRFERPRLPVVFVIGAPRSGSTLVSQSLAHAGIVGYISNFVARFWQAPMIGARIERALDLRGAGATDFSSEHGVTRGLGSPHEFGYFWSKWFDFGQETHKLTEVELQSVNSSGMLRGIAALESVYATPMSFKNNTWCTFQAHYLARILPNSIFLVCRREPIYIAQSMLAARRRRLGGEQHWWSMRPSTYRNLLALPWWDQIAGQALEIGREMDDSLRQVSPERILNIDYRKFCARPASLLEELAERLAAAGCEPVVRRQLPERFEHTDQRRVPEEDWRRLAQALEARRARQ